MFFVIRADILHFICSQESFNTSQFTHSLFEQTFIKFLLAIKSWLGPRGIAPYLIRHDLSLEVCGKKAQDLVNIMSVMKGKLLHVLLVSNKVSLQKDQ